MAGTTCTGRTAAAERYEAAPGSEVFSGVPCEVEGE